MFNKKQTKKEAFIAGGKKALQVLGVVGLAAAAVYAESKQPGLLTGPTTDDLSTGRGFARTDAYRTTRTELTREVRVTWNTQTRGVVERLKGAIADAEKRGGAFLFVENHYDGTATIKLTARYCFFPEDLDATEAALNALDLFKVTGVPA